MIPKAKFIIRTTTFLLLGMFLFFLQKGWVVLDLPDLKDHKIIHKSPIGQTFKKNIKLYYMKNNKPYHDEASVIWSDITEDVLKNMVNTWLSFMYDEQLIDRKIHLENVLLSESGQVAYLSFDSIIILQDWSIHKKWNFIESLLKTIKNSSLNVQSLVFLVKHKKMQDEHLDFTHEWPIYGFGDS